MNETINYNDIFKTCIFLSQYKKQLTIDIAMIQCAFRIHYDNNPLARKAENNANKYIEYLIANECSTTEFKKANRFKKILKDFLDSTGKELYNCNYRISGNVGVYLCGLDDVFDDTFKDQYSSLGKTPAKKATKNKDPLPEDICDEEEPKTIKTTKTAKKKEDPLPEEEDTKTVKTKKTTKKKEDPIPEEEETKTVKTKKTAKKKEDPVPEEEEEKEDEEEIVKPKKTTKKNSSKTI